ncbi:MAG: GNAT family N-acetyltransferase [Bacteroidota bacterium]
MALQVRKANQRDIPALKDLINQLGYKTSLDEMKIRFENISRHLDFLTLLAEVDHEVVGMIGATKNYSYEYNGIHIQIVALSVSRAYQNRNIGKVLVSSVENWARELGSNRVLVNCGNREERKIAHLFYAKMGFEANSLGYVKLLE